MCSFQLMLPRTLTCKWTLPLSYYLGLQPKVTNYASIIYPLRCPCQMRVRKTKFGISRTWARMRRGVWFVRATTLGLPQCLMVQAVKPRLIDTLWSLLYKYRSYFGKIPRAGSCCFGCYAKSITRSDFIQIETRRVLTISGKFANLFGSHHFLFAVNTGFKLWACISTRIILHKHKHKHTHRASWGISIRA